MEAREALQMVMGGLPDIENYSEAIEVLADLVNRREPDPGPSGDWEEQYKSLRREYERRFSEYTRPDTVRNVVDESIRAGFDREDAYNRDREDIGLADLDMSFDARTE